VEPDKNHSKHNPGPGKPLNLFGDYLWAEYNCRVLKLPINAGLSCPNRDGTFGTSGCTFCAEDGSAAPTTGSSPSIIEQMRFARSSFKRSDAETRYIAYFQAYTNTHAPVPVLRSLYDSALSDKDIIGLMIGTRPDCLPDDVLDLIASYRKKDFELWLEIGMQTMHNRSLDYLNRRHSHGSTVDAVMRAARKQIPVCVHVILGIPGESWQDMMDTAEEISSMPVMGVKIHHMHVIRGTRLEELYNRGDFKTLSLREYVSCVCDFIERLRPDIILHRLMGDRESGTLVSPLWSLRKGTVIQSIEDEFKRRGTFQGFMVDPFTEHDLPGDCQ